jgi:hypothetical protein
MEPSARISGEISFMADQTGSMTGVWDGEKIHRNLPLAAPILPG